MSSWRTTTACLRQLELSARRNAPLVSKAASTWLQIFTFLTEQCKRSDTAAHAGGNANNAYNENVDKICQHFNALQVLREVLLSLAFTDAARRTWSVESPFANALEVIAATPRPPSLPEYVVAQSDAERKQVLIALLKLLYCMSGYDVARKEFFQNGYMTMLFSLSLAPLCMCFQAHVNQHTRGGVRHIDSCVKNCAETLVAMTNDETGDIRYHATNTLCNMCHCVPLKELIGGIGGSPRVRSLVAVAEHSLQRGQTHITGSALAALRNLTSNRVNARVLGALQMYGRLLQLLRSLLAAIEKQRGNQAQVLSACQHVFAVFVNASRSVRAVDCMSVQTNDVFATLKEVSAIVPDGAALYAQFERNCDAAAERRAQNEFDTSDEGELQADDLLDNVEHSSIADNHSAADATDSSAYDKNLTGKQQRIQAQMARQAQVVTPAAATAAGRPRQQQQQQAAPPQPQQQVLQHRGDDDRLLESAQVFMREQRVDTTVARSSTGAVRIDSIVPQFEYSRIEFKQQIGKGTYSVVHSALYYGYRIAAKILNVPLPENAVAREKILLEFRLMAMLRHPNIVQLMGIACTPSTPHLVVCTELCSRGSLKDNLETVADMTVRIKFAKHTIAGLHWLHCNNIIHRDLKPANLLVRDDYSVVIADFGLSLYIGATPAERPISRHFKGTWSLFPCLRSFTCSNSLNCA
jgi:hypothetical protein